LIRHLQLFRNVGKFDSVAAGANIALAPLTLIYAENGRGKTTLAAIFRSLATGDPLLIAERHRLAAPNPPHIVIDCDGGPPPAIFQNGAWNRALPQLVVFDDMFVDQNVCSGLAVDAEHRQRLHEWILGAHGVNLNRALQDAVARIEEHNRELRAKGDAIPANVRGGLTVDRFCALEQRVGIDAMIQDAERNLAAAQAQDRVRTTGAFDPIGLPEIDLGALSRLLAQDLPALDAAAAKRVQAHFASIGNGGETWVASGMQRIGDGQPKPCPFCAQDLANSPIIEHYRAYFSEAYAALKADVASAITHYIREHGGNAPAAFERAIRTMSERRIFWAQFADVPEIAIDTAATTQAWSAARDAAIAALTTKQNAPLERIVPSGEMTQAVAVYDRFREEVATLSELLARANVGVAVVKEQAAAGNVAALESDVAALKAVRARHLPETLALCDAYLQEKAAKALVEQQRDTARVALDQHRQNVFPNYQAAINEYLRRFNAGFRLDRVTSNNTRAGSSCTYDVLINNLANHPIAVTGAEPQPGTPSFRNSLSAGDRNTLALAFFFASLDQDPQVANTIAVIDDPITSLDEHRSLTTVQETRKLAERTSQVIVLSHDKAFLCNIWKDADPDVRAALEVVRDGAGSTLRVWDVNRDTITEHDRRHELLRGYLEGAPPDTREVAQSIRPVLEAFLRVACPANFPPGTLLGRFRGICEQRVGTPQEILNQADITELTELTEYANRFHHDTNPAWQTANINDGELVGFVQRTLAFAKRR
jgi:wobble nucleotide-excising tRNase